MSAMSATENKTSLDKANPSRSLDDEMFDLQFGSGYRDEGDYREGFKKPWKKY